MIGSTADRNPFERLAEDFAERLRRGEHPAINDDIARYPELGDDVRDLFPEIAAVEQCQPFEIESRAPLSGAFPPVRPGPLPDQLGDYRMLRYLGAGGMGVVYQAVRESLRSTVALKVMHPQFRDREQDERRFRTEARSTARLHHTNIVSVFDYGVHERVCHYAMPYIAGHSLDKILADVSQLRREKEGLAAREAAEMVFEPQAPPGSAPWLAPSQAGETLNCASSRTLSLGLINGEWTFAASTPDSNGSEVQRPSAATVAVETRLKDRWPIRPDSAHGPDAISIGPPQLLWELTTDLAWKLATDPAALRDPEKALTAARKAVALAPGVATYGNTLGVAQFRAGMCAEADRHAGEKSRGRQGPVRRL